MKNLIKGYLFFRILVEGMTIILVALAMSLIFWFITQLTVMFL